MKFSRSITFIITQGPCTLMISFSESKLCMSKLIIYPEYLFMFLCFNIKPNAKFLYLLFCNYDNIKINVIFIHETY